MSDFLAKVIAQLDMSQANNAMNTFLNKNYKVNVDVNLNTGNINVNNFLNQIKSQFGRAGNIAGANFTNSINSSLGNINIKNAASQIANLQRTLKSMNFNSSSIDTITRDLQEMELAVAKVTTRMNGQNLNVRVDGIDQMGRAVSVVKEFDSVTGKMQRTSETVSTSMKQMFTSIDVSKLNASITALDANFTKLKGSINSESSELRSLKQELANISNIQGLNNQQAEFERITLRVKELSAAYKTAKSEATSAAAAQQLMTGKAVLGNQIVTWMNNNTKAAKIYGSQLKALQSQLQSVSDLSQLKGVSQGFKEIKSDAAASGSLGKSVFSKLVASMTNLSPLFGIGTLINTSIRGLKDMYHNVVNIDTAMTELKKVTNESEQAYSNFLDSASKRSVDIGTTISNYVSSTADFARLGYSLKESQGLAEVANIYKVVGDGISSIDEASQSVISTLTAFGYEAKDAISIVDKFNEVGNKFAISSGGIGEALTRSASSLATANNTLDESIAMIAAANTVVQDPTKVGTAFKTISMRIRGAKTELEDAGLETDGMAESTAKLRQEIKALSSVDIMLDDTTFKSTYQIMDELSKKWSDLTDIQQASITELIAGKHQGNVMSSLMENFDIARKALDISVNSQGSAMEEHAKQMESIQARINQLKASWEELSQSFLKSDFVKGTISGITGIVKVIDSLIDRFGTVATTAVGVGLFKTIKGITSAFKVLKESRTFDNLRLSSQMLAALDKAFPKLSNSITVMSAAARSGSSALASLSAGATALFGSFAPLVGIAAALGAVFVGFNAYENHMQKQVEIAKEAGTAWEDNNTSLQSNIDRITELKTALDSGTLSEQEAYDAKAELLSIQDSLTESYENQITGIDLVNGKMDEQIAKLKELSDAQSNQFLNENQKGIEKSKKEMEKDRHTFLGQFSPYLEDADKLQSILNKYKDKGIFIDDSSPDGIINVHFKGDATEADQTLNSLMTDLRAAASESENVDLFEGFLENASIGLQEAKKVLDEYEELYTQSLKAEVQTDRKDYGGKTASEWLGNYAKAVNQYNDAVANGSQQEIDNARRYYNEIHGSVNKLISGTEFSRFGTLVNDIDSQLNTAAISAKEFNNAISGEGTSGYQKNIESLLDSIKKLNMSDVDFKAAISSGGTAAIDKLAYYAEKAGISTDDLSDSLVELGVLSGRTSAEIEEASANISSFVETATSNVSNFSNALSESASETGLTTESIDNIKNSFSELEGVNLDGLFINTAEGVKLNVDAMGDLVDIQHELQSQEIAEEIKKQNDAIREQKDELKNLTGEKRESAEANIKAMEEDLAAMQRTQAQYHALYQQQKEMFSQYHQWEIAKNTANAGDKYKNLASGLKEAKELFDKDLVGTDEFKKFAQLISPSGADDPVNFAENYRKAARYLTEDSTGVQNFLTDLSTKTDSAGQALASFNKETGEWTYNIKDMASAAQQMGMGKEFMSSMFGRLEDYGFHNNVISDQEDGILKLTEAYSNLAQAKSKLSEMEKNPSQYDNDALEQQREKVSSYQRDIEELNANLQSYVENYADSYNQKIESAKTSINALNEQRKQILADNAYGENTSAIASGMESQIKQWAEENNLELDAELNVIGVKKSSLDELKDLEESKKIDIGVDLNYDSSSMTVDELESKIQKLEGAKAKIGVDTDEGAYAVEKINNEIRTLQNQKVHIRIQTAIDGGSSVESLLGLSDADLAKKLEIDTSEVAEARAQLESLSQTATDASVTVQIDKTQFDALTETTKTITVNYEKGKQQEPDDKKATVDYKRGDQKPPVDKGAKVNYLLGSQAPPVPKSTSVYYYRGYQEPPSSKTASVTYITKNYNGTANYYGTAYANGSLFSSNPMVRDYWAASGKAYAMGYDWGLPFDQTSLVNELGEESVLRVRDSRFEVIRGGAQFATFKKGDIIFNHKQTEELLKNGKVTSGGGRGKIAHANGTAYNAPLNVIGSAYASGSGYGKFNNTFISGNHSSSGSNNYSSSSSGKSSGSSSKGSSSVASSSDEEKNKIDWIDVALQRLERTIKNLQRTAESAFKSFTTRNKALNKQINSVTSEIKTQEKAYKRYIKEANSVGLSSALRKKVQKGEINISEYDEDTRKKIDEYTKWYEAAFKCKDSIADLKVNLVELKKQKFENLVKKWDNAVAKLSHNIERLQSLIDRRSSYASEYVSMDKSEQASKENIKGYQKIISETQKVIARKVKKLNDLRKNLDLLVENGDITKGSEDWYELQEEIWNTESEIDELNSNIIDASNNISAEYMKMFENVATEYENKLGLAEHLANHYSNVMSQAEAKGYLASKKYYEMLKAIEQDKISSLVSEKADLEKAMYNALASGEIEKGSQAYYDMRNQINSVSEALQEAELNMINFDNAMREAEWGHFDYLQEQISQLNKESDFLIDLMSNSKMYDDKGNITAEGQATLGLHGQNYNVLMSQADKYASEIEKINAEMANDPNNTKLIERKQQLIAAQWESVKAAEAEKQAIIDLVEEGIKVALDNLKNLISEYKNALDSQKELHDFQKKIEEQTKNIASLQKQLMAYQNDVSEETQAKIQKIKEQLEKAKDDLDETKYDKYISDQKKLLDDLYDEYEKALNERLDNTDYLIQEVIDSINANSGEIYDTLSNVASDVGVTLSEELQNIWDTSISGAMGETRDVLSMYNDNFSSTMTTLQSTVNGIQSAVDALVEAANAEAERAKAELEAEENRREEMEQDALDKAEDNKNNTKDDAEDATNNDKTEPPKTPPKYDSSIENAELEEVDKKKPTSSKPKTKNVKVGDVLTFKSGRYYEDSQGNGKSGNYYLGQKVKITHINSANWAKYPYAINSADGKMSLGWVSLDQLYLKGYKLKGYASGARSIPGDQDAWVNELGTEGILSKKQDGIITHLYKGDSVLTSEQMSRIYDLATNPQAFLGSMWNTMPKADGVNKSGNTIVQRFENITFEMPNVKNYNELITEMQRDKNFEKLMQSMTVDQTAGKSPNKKFSFKF